MSLKWNLTAALLAFFLLGAMMAGAANEGGNMQTRLVQAGDHVIEVFVYGEGSQTLIMAAGNGRPATQLNRLASEISRRGIRVATYNYRGIGKSTGDAADLTLANFADDVWAIADTLGVAKVHLAGKTFGNRVMRAASQAHPDRVASIILIGAGGEVAPSAETIALYKRYLTPGIPKDEWISLHAQLNYAPANAHLAAKDADEGTYPAVARNQTSASERTPGALWLRGGDAPMLAIACLLDRIAVPENALNIGKSRPDTWVAGLPGCGHNMVNERPDEIRDLILDFIDRHPSAQGG